jgi:hypothetical protein
MILTGPLGKSCEKDAAELIVRGIASKAILSQFNAFSFELI